MNSRRELLAALARRQAAIAGEALDVAWLDGYAAGVDAARTERVRAGCVRELMGTFEVCQALGVTRAGLKKWRDRGEFPAPLAVLACSPVWDGCEVRIWHAKQRGDRVARGRSA